MSDSEPEAVVKAQRLVQGARSHVQGQLDEVTKRGTINLGLLQALKSLIDQGATARRELADTLAQTSPASVLGLDDPGKRPTYRHSKLQSALIEAALAEQQSPAGQLLEGPFFSPVLLEESLDSWLTAGEYRGRENSPLTEIARMVARSSSTSEEGLQTRLGLLVPVIATIHLWRCVYLASTQVQVSLGWCRSGEASRALDDKAVPLHCLG